MNNSQSKIPLGEHILQTGNFISMLSDKMPDISKMVTNVLEIKKRKRLMLAEPKPQQEETEYPDNPLEADRL